MNHEDKPNTAGLLSKPASKVPTAEPGGVQPIAPGRVWRIRWWYDSIGEQSATVVWCESRDEFRALLGGLDSTDTVSFEHSPYEILKETDSEERLSFLMSQFQMHSPDMGGDHSYRFRNAGWPMAHFRGPSVEAAIDNAIAEVKKQKETDQ